MAPDIPLIFTRDRAALAPLAGVTDSVYRRICVRFGARPVITGMVSSKGYLRGKPTDKTAQLLIFHESERPIGFQFFGSNPDIMAEAALKALELKPDFIDINAGCPAKKVVAKGSGSALLQSPYLLGRIVDKVVGVSTVPVTVKIRSGWDQTSINAVEVARICVNTGAHALVVHPRTGTQGFSGVSDWSVIRAVKEAVAVPVIGSGDITTPDDAAAMLDETGADAIMIGRSAMGNPWIFRQVKERLNGSEVSEAPSFAERLDLALWHLDMLVEERSERIAVLNMRKFFGWYSRGVRDGAIFRNRIFRAETIEEVKHIVWDFQVQERVYEKVPITIKSGNW